jgi:NAD(P)-dependent dehydrogenase (short-subunit alcohol dehydrogenase family)
MKLEGKVALVTGGGRGIGAAIAKRFLDDGAKVVISDIRKDLLDAMAKSLRTGNLAICTGDVTKFDDVKNMVDETIGFGGKIDILVNNAGIDNKGNILDIDIGLWKKMLDVNLTGPFLTGAVLMVDGGAAIVDVSGASVARAGVGWGV